MKRTRNTSFILLALFITLTNTIQGQTEDSSHLLTKDTLKVSLNLGAQGNLQSGPLDGVTMMFSNELSIENSKIKLLSRTRYAYGKRQGRLVINDLYSINRLFFLPQKCISPFVMGGHISSLIYKLNARRIGGVGASLNIIKPQKNYHLALHQAVVYEDVSFLTSEGYKSSMYSLGLFGRNTLLKNKVILNYHVLSFHSLKQKGIYHYVGNLGIVLPIKRIISFKMNCTYLYENKTDASITEKRSLLLNYGLQFKL